MKRLLGPSLSRIIAPFFLLAIFYWLWDDGTRDVESSALLLLCSNTFWVQSISQIRSKSRTFSPDQSLLTQFTAALKISSNFGLEIKDGCDMARTLKAQFTYLYSIKRKCYNLVRQNSSISLSLFAISAFHFTLLSLTQPFIFQPWIPNYLKQNKVVKVNNNSFMMVVVSRLNHH